MSRNGAGSQAVVSVGRGHGKLLLFGEHAAVYGYPACGLTLEKGIRLTLVRRLDPSPEGRRWSLPPLPPARRAELEGFLDRSRPLFPEATPWGGAMAIDSDLPTGLGFGSSAAWCAAFVSALLGKRGDIRERWTLAHTAEAFFHGTPSGIDTGLALLGGLYAFTPSPPALPSAEPLPGGPLDLVVGAVGRTSSTKELVGALRSRFEGGERLVRESIARLGELSLAAAEILRREGSPGEALGALAQEAHMLLSRLGLSTRELDAMLAAGLAAGSLGGKLSGAGGGGAFYLVYRDRAAAERGAELLRARAAELRIDSPVFVVDRPPLSSTVRSTAPADPARGVPARDPSS